MNDRDEETMRVALNVIKLLEKRVADGEYELELAKKAIRDLSGELEERGYDIDALMCEKKRLEEVNAALNKMKVGQYNDNIDGLVNDVCSDISPEDLRWAREQLKGIGE